MKTIFTISFALNVHAQNSLFVSFHPNPFKNQINIASPETYENCILINMKGKTIRWDTGNESINTRYISPGLYLQKMKTPHTTILTN